MEILKCKTSYWKYIVRTIEKNAWWYEYEKSNYFFKKSDAIDFIENVKLKNWQTECK